MRARNPQFSYKLVDLLTNQILTFITWHLSVPTGMGTMSDTAYKYILIFVLFFLAGPLAAQEVVTIAKDTEEHVFKLRELVALEDGSNALTIDQVSSQMWQGRFRDTKHYYPKNYDRNASYWYRVKVNFKDGISDAALIEFFDQTTGQVEAYLPGRNGKYVKYSSGSLLEFTNRLFEHKNFEFKLQEVDKGVHNLYFKVRSPQEVNVIIVYRSLSRFIYYSLREYFSYGLFYGMILVFSLHNLLMFLAVKRRQYVYYILYIISVGLYEMSTDGIAFQFLWPDYPELNKVAHGVALYCLSISALVFTKELLHVKSKAPRLNKVLNWVIVVRSAFFLFCLLYSQEFFRYKVLEVFPLSIAFFTGIWIWRKKKFRPARFFVLGYFFLFIGFMVKVAYVLGVARLFPSALGHYSLGFGFILEMIFLSFAIGDQVRILKKKKENSQRQIIKQMKVNADLSESINKDLEAKVQKRTKEVIEKSQELIDKSTIIKQQNEELLAQNDLLERQAEEISRMNALLKNDNQQLKTDIAQVTDARALAKDMDFEEFSMKYPDKDSCYKFLAEMKWAKGYQCIKCGNATYCNGRAPYNRRCTKCSYEESVLHKTLFENNRIPINKAFYLVYLMYNHKGAISSHQLSEKLGIRQSTCWSYAVRMKKVMDERKKDLKGVGASGWSKLVLER